MIEVWCESSIGRDGRQYFVLMDKVPCVNSNGLYNGGHFYSFHLDHAKNTTELYEYVFLNGVPTGFDRCLKKWKDEIITIQEAIKYITEER